MSMPENLLILPSFLLLFTHGTLNLVCEKASFPLARVDKKSKPLLRPNRKWPGYCTTTFSFCVLGQQNKAQNKVPVL